MFCFSGVVPEATILTEKDVAGLVNGSEIF
jgi:hypothetical protein